MKLNQQNYISMDDSTILYGIAILLMVFHHCFATPSRLGNQYIPCLFGFENEARLAYIGRMCVGIYAFISGYALSRKANPHSKYLPHFVYDVKISLNALIKFYSKFWLIFAIFIPIGVLFFDYELSWNSLRNGLLFGFGYNWEWWYIFQYMKFLLVFPFLNAFFLCYDRSRKHFTVLALLIAALFVSWRLHLGRGSIPMQYITLLFETFLSSAMCIFLTAFVIGKMKVYEHLSSILRLPWILNAAIVIFLLAVRWFVVSDPGDSRYDIVILPFWMFNVVQLVHSFGYRNAVASILLSLGRNSTNMWLLHTFWLYYYFQPIILLPRYSILIFLWAVLISYVNARAVDWLSRRIGIPKAVSWISAWIMGPIAR